MKKQSNEQENLCENDPLGKKSINSLRICSFNTHLFKNTIVMQFFFEEIRLKGIIAQLKKEQFDIVVLNEVWSDKVKRRIVSDLGSKYKYHAAKFTPWNKMGSGLLVVSKYPLKDIQFRKFNDLATWDKLSQKGVLSCSVEYMEDRFIRLYASHCQAEEYPDIRKKNYEQIRDEAKGYESEKQHDGKLIIGDLNTSYDKNKVLEYEGMMEVFEDFEDSFSGNEFIPTHNTLKNITWQSLFPNNTEEPRKLDFILASKKDFSIIDFGVKHWKINAKIKKKITQIDLSDHYAIFCELKIKENL